MLSDNSTFLMLKLSKSRDDKTNLKLSLAQNKTEYKHWSPKQRNKVKFLVKSLQSICLVRILQPL